LKEKLIKEKIEMIIEKCIATPAILLNLSNVKGKIYPGYDADFIIWNP